MKLEYRTEGENTLCILLKEKTEIGRCLFLPTQEGAELKKLRICPEWRGKGYGTFLLKGVLTKTGGFARNARCMHTAPSPATAGEEALLKKFGFEPGAGLWVRRRVPELTAVDFVQEQLKRMLPEAGFYIDATCGNGHDTAFLCRLAGNEGRVLALDIQQEAVKNTKNRPEVLAMGERAQVVCISHSELLKIAEPETADGIMFNFGYLPGADHSLFTHGATSLPAIRAALSVLKPGGVLSACLYSGGPNGTEERDSLLRFFRQLPLTGYTVLECRFANWADTAPLPVLVLKKQI